MDLCQATSELNRWEHLQSLPDSLESIKSTRNQREQVLAVAEVLTSSVGASIWEKGERWSFEDVISELINHDDFAGALLASRQGNSLPINTLLEKTARSLACTILRIDADSIGLTV